MLAAFRADVPKRVFDRPCFLVAPLVRQGVVNIRQRDDPGAERDHFAANFARISAAIPLLVMIEGYLLRNE